LASLGHYVATTEATSQTPAALGSYVDTIGAFAAKLAPVGHYVDKTGQTAALAAPMAGQQFSYTFTGFNVTPVPEPRSTALLLAGLGALAGWRRCRGRRDFRA
jgi:hypothetical protein